MNKSTSRTEQSKRKEEVKNFIAEFDANHDGKVTLEEWKEFHLNMFEKFAAEEGKEDSQ